MILDKNGDPISIGILAFHHCIRCVRQATAFKSVGYEVYGNANKIPYGSDVYDSFFVFKGERQFKHNVKTMIDAGVTLLSWENEPHHPAVWIREVINEMGKQDEVKLVSNIHDSDMIRRRMTTRYELEMFRVSDAVIYVSDPIEDILNNLYNVTTPSMVLYNYPTKKMVEDTQINWDDIPNRKGLVYEGGINAIGDTPEIIRTNQILKYRDLFPIFKKLIEMGNEVHAFSGNTDAYVSGQHTGVILYPPTDFKELLNKMTAFRYNLVVFNNEKGTEDQVNFTTANKIWDGLVAGLPSITCYCGEMEKYVSKHGIGVVAKSLNDIGNATQWDNIYGDLIENIKKKREELVFENQIWRSENLFAKLLGLQRKGIPNRIKEQAIFEYGEKSVTSLLN